MKRTHRAGAVALGVAAALMCAFDAVGIRNVLPGLRSSGEAVAQENGRGGRNRGEGRQGGQGGGGQNWRNRQGGGQQGGPGGQGGDWRNRQGGGQQGGSGGQNWRNRQGGPGGGPGGPGGPGGRFSPEQIIQNMTAERFERMKNAPFAANIREQVGDAQWSRWEQGDFSSSVSAAEAAAAAAEGRPLEPEMSDEEKAEAEALLKSGSVPDFSEGGKPYSITSEEEYYQNSLAHRDDSLVPAVPVAIRFYSRYLISKYDTNGNGVLEREEWEGKIPGAQAIDLEGDWVLTDQEILFYLARYAKGRSISNPEPAKQQTPKRANVVVVQEERPVLIRTASAPPRAAEREQAELEREGNALSDDEMTALAELSDEEFREMMTQDNPAMESVEDEELLGVLLADMDESSVREYAAPPQALVGTPVWFLARDVNGDGQLTLLEFAPNLSVSAVALFGKMDANSDGFVTADEVRAFTKRSKQ